MANLRAQRRRGTRSEDGASLVEFALILPLLCVLLFGMLTGGLTMSRQNSVKNAVREATRFGAVAPAFPEAGDTGPSELDSLYGQLVAGATGDLSNSTDGRIICVALIDGDDNWWWAVHTDSDTPDASGDEDVLADVDTRCTETFDATVGSGTDRIWVRAVRQSEIDAIFYAFPVTLDSHALSRYER